MSSGPSPRARLPQTAWLGLIDCWRPHFLQANGRRFLTIFGSADFDRLCPPTELSRVGILLTEFGSTP